MLFAAGLWPGLSHGVRREIPLARHGAIRNDAMVLLLWRLVFEVALVIGRAMIYNCRRRQVWDCMDQPQSSKVALMYGRTMDPVPLRLHAAYTSSYRCLADIFFARFEFISGIVAVVPAAAELPAKTKIDDD